MRPPPPAMASTVPATKEASDEEGEHGKRTGPSARAIYQLRNRVAMFIGHFGLAFAAKRLAPRTGLGTLFAASQWVDLLWPVLLLLGIEQVRIAPGDTAYTSLAFVHYPWTHSLLMSIAWALFLGLAYRLATGERRGAWVVGALVASHWVLDFVTHRPDLPVVPWGAGRSGSASGTTWRRRWPWRGSSSRGASCSTPRGPVRGGAPDDVALWRWWPSSSPWPPRTSSRRPRRVGRGLGDPVDVAHRRVDGLDQSAASALRLVRVVGPGVSGHRRSRP